MFIKYGLAVGLVEPLIKIDIKQPNYINQQYAIQKHNHQWMQQNRQKRRRTMCDAPIVESIIDEVIEKIPALNETTGFE